jgi:hypothetical protein
MRSSHQVSNFQLWFLFGLTFLVPHSAWKDQELHISYVQKLVASYQESPELTQLLLVTDVAFPKTKKFLKDVSMF